MDELPNKVLTQNKESTVSVSSWILKSKYLESTYLSVQEYLTCLPSPLPSVYSKVLLSYLSVSPYTTLAPHSGRSSTSLMARSRVSLAFLTMLSATLMFKESKLSGFYVNTLFTC